MFEEATCVASGDANERPAHRFDQSLVGVCFKLTQRSFPFGQSLLDEIKISSTVGEEPEVEVGLV